MEQESLGQHHLSAANHAAPSRIGVVAAQRRKISAICHPDTGDKIISKIFHSLFGFGVGFMGPKKPIAPT